MCHYHLPPVVVETEKSVTSEIIVVDVSLPLTLCSGSKFVYW